MRPFRIVSIATAAWWLCCSTFALAEAPENNIPASGTLTLQKGTAPAPEDPRDLAGTITLQQVIAHVLLHNPELEMYSLEIRAREARTLQAGLLPNPSIYVGTENVFSSGNVPPTNPTQNTVTLSQVIELGGKRSKRKQAANLDTDLAHWDYETRRMDVLTRVTQAYVEVLRAQEQRKLNDEMVQLSENALEAVSARVEAGKVPPIEEVKAQVTLSQVKIKWEQAKNQLDAARRRLATLWGRSSVAFDRAQGDLYAIQTIPGFQILSEKLTGNPDLARWATELLKRDADLALAQSKAIPDLRLGAGARRFEGIPGDTFIFEIELPLSLFDRNQGAIAEARHRRVQAEARRRAVAMQLNAALNDTYTQLTNAYTRVVSLKTKVLPGARTAFDAVDEGYKFGKFGYLEYLDSQRTWFQARSEYLNALAEYHQSVASVERLIGSPLDSNNDANPIQTGGLQ